MVSIDIDDSGRITARHPEKGRMTLGHVHGITGAGVDRDAVIRQAQNDVREIAHATRQAPRELGGAS